MPVYQKNYQEIVKFLSFQHESFYLFKSPKRLNNNTTKIVGKSIFFKLISFIDFKV